MPRSTKSRRASVSVSSNKTVKDPIKMPAATATITEETEPEMRTDLPFEVAITPAPEGFKPDRSPAGRKRIPSPFEPILPGLKGKGWQNQPHDGKVVPENIREIEADGEVAPKYNTLSSIPKNEDGSESDTVPSVRESNARIILRELQKAVKFLNSEAGGELNLGLDVNVTEEFVQFNIREKQKRERKNGAVDTSGAVEDYEDVDEDVDDDSGDE